MRARTRRLATISAGVLGMLLAPAPSALADHHSVSIREVFPGSTTAGASSEFVELQAYDPGQTNYGGDGQRLDFYEPGGANSPTVTLGVDVVNGANQATALYATADAQGDFGVTPDFLGANSDFMNPIGGAVCFRSTSFATIDCVAWGTFDNTGPGLPVGTNETGPIPDGSSIVRTIAPGNPSLLEAGDDTGDSQADFSALATPTPCPNTAVQTPTICAFSVPPVTSPPGNPASPINPAGNVRKRKCKKKPKSASATKKRRCKKKK